MLPLVNVLVGSSRIVGEMFANRQRIVLVEGDLVSNRLGLVQIITVVLRGAGARPPSVEAEILVSFGRG